MRAIVVTANGGPDVLDLQDVPEPEPGPGEVLVDVEAIGVNYRDVYEREGLGSYTAPTPLVAGVELAGEVAAVGEGVHGVRVGDRVATVAARGAYAERALVDAAKTVPVPAELSAEQAAAVLLQGMTAQYLATATYAIQPGDWAVVHAAAGGVGLLLTQIVKARGGNVLATTSTDEKAELARGAGADEVVRYDEFAARAKELSGEGAAVVYDGVGISTFLHGFDALRPRGLLVLYGAAAGAPEPLDLALLGRGSFAVTRPTLGHYTRTPEELRSRAEAVFAWVASGVLDVRVGAVYPLAEARRAHEELEGRRSTGKLLLLP
ncbi:MAG TPA: quinone oxidoreductase [Gaiellaceae bacterium]|nr:quinone oxidoreductase [Gaiellaceae bacterium]